MTLSFENLADRMLAKKKNTAQLGFFSTFRDQLNRKIIPPDSPHHDDLALYRRVLAQHRKDSDKVYSLHEPDVKCISKGKDHKKYEFGRGGEPQ